MSGAWSTELASSFDIKLPSQILRELPHGKNLLNKHQDDLIFDIGMNNGDDTDFYLKKGFRVISIKPFQHFALLQQKDSKTMSIAENWSFAIWE